MGTEVLRPQDCLIERLRVGPTTSSVLPRRKSSYTNSNSKPSSYRKTVIRPEQQPKRREPSAATAVAVVVTADGSRKNYNNNNTNNLTIGSSQVTILKRGESLNIIKSNKNESLKRTVSSTGDLIGLGLGSSSSTSFSESRSIGPDPELVPKQIRITDLKSSSSTTVRSHHHHEVYAGSAFYMSPSPSALPLPTFSIKKEGLAIVDDSATKDLRRLLRLD